MPEKGSNNQKALHQGTSKCFSDCSQAIYLRFRWNEKNKDQRLTPILRRDQYEAIHKLVFTERTRKYKELRLLSL